MKNIFYLGIAGIIIYETAKVYFIMPMPGSQEINSIDIAYFLHYWRWVFRAVFWLMIILGAKSVFSGNKSWWRPAFLIALALGVTYANNFQMAADVMFYQPNHLVLAENNSNKVGQERLVIGVELNGEAKAYPIQFIGYHHQVADVIGGKPVIVTYCTVCRTGRVFEPLIDGKKEQFRLVGMDHFNAMFEDKSTGSWWRQANGEAIAGVLKGRMLPEVASSQSTLGQWLKLHPDSKIMQPDPEFQAKYDSMSLYETGGGKSALTKTDTISWHDKSWVVGIATGKGSKAFDWNKLKAARVIHETVGEKPVTLVLGSDNHSFSAFDVSELNDRLVLRNDTLFSPTAAYDLAGRRLSGEGDNLKKINAYQEFWHSWRTFHPDTERF